MFVKKILIWYNARCLLLEGLELGACLAFVSKFILFLNVSS